MIQVYKPENKNYENNGDCVLHPTKCELTMQLSGEWDMEIECAADALYIDCLKAGSVITAPTPYGENEQFRVYDAEKTSSISHLLNSRRLKTTWWLREKMNTEE